MDVLNGYYPMDPWPHLKLFIHFKTITSQSENSYIILQYILNINGIAFLLISERMTLSGSNGGWYAAVEIKNKNML